MPVTPLDKLCIDTVRTLSMDAVQKANSGHPGTPMALAPLGYALFARHMRHDPADPKWADRDRFVLSCGHASMLLYSCLYLSGYDVSLDDLKAFRQWGSRTPGHPEYTHTPGVETTTGPLGQGVGNAVGMAVAEAHMAATFNREGHAILDHYTWFICSDGDLMEGVSHEAASFAGHFKLGKLIGFWDDNRITIDGSTDLTFTDDTAKRFEAYGWQVLHVADVNDLDEIDRVVAEAKADATRPSFIVTRTRIGFGSPKEGTSSAHGEPLGAENIVATKKKLGWPKPEEPFFVPGEALAHWRETKARGTRAHAEWKSRYDKYGKAFPAEAKELLRRMSGALPEGWESVVPNFTAENGAVASRAASQTVLNALAGVIPELIGGSADLTPSNGTAVKSWASFAPGDYDKRYMHFGIREHGMGSIMNGMALHGGVIPFGGTFLIFSDYLRPTLRLASIMKQRVIFIFTHDSIGLGEDGPTHQPVEQLAAIRAIPQVTLIRPADATETAEAWKIAVSNTTGPTCLVLTRQKLGFIDRTKFASAEGVRQGGYVLAEAEGGRPDVVLLSSGSEVALVMSAREKLAAEGVRARVVSMASHELFARQSQAYRDSVLPKGVPRVAIEAATTESWYRLVGDGVVLGIDRYGASAPYETVYSELGITVEKVVEAAAELAGRGRQA
ncbi:MAG: transketolase [Gemmatimonadetes bacterium]|nr:transketolase [Gemmatimonadota bacterium]